jgi:hypothetical protein
MKSILFDGLSQVPIHSKPFTLLLLPGSLPSAFHLPFCSFVFSRFLCKVDRTRIHFEAANEATKTGKVVQATDRNLSYF